MSTTTVKRRLGAPVIYTLNESDVQQIILQRRQAGLAAKHGNDPKDGDSFPGIIVADFGRGMTEHAAIRERIASGEWAEGDSERLAKQLAAHDNEPNIWSCNIQVWLDGTDTYWATSREQFNPEKHGRRVQVIDGIDHEMPANSMDQGADMEFRPDRRGHWTYADSTPRD